VICIAPAVSGDGGTSGKVGCGLANEGLVFEKLNGEGGLVVVWIACPTLDGAGVARRIVNADGWFVGRNVVEKGLVDMTGSGHGVADDVEMVVY